MINSFFARGLSATLLILLSLISPRVSGQHMSPATPGEILLGLHKLQVTGAVLYVAAHPDDENTRLLAWLANERKLRTGYLSLTRGDGGQNLIGKEQGEMLGLLRTQELLAARRTDGAEQFFTRANDFGFSKNPEETFSIWNRDSVLADVVWTIRKFRPDVIICRFPSTGEGGHGHHTASAILAAEAFDAAADPKRFPHQLAWVSTWQPRRLFWNTFNFGTTNTTAPNQLKVDVGGYNALLGKSYGEIAAESRTFHKSQGFGSAKQRGESFEYFKQIKGDSARTDLFEGINQGWTRMPAASKIAALAAAAVKAFEPQAPEATLPALAAIHKQLSTLNGTQPELSYWRAQKLKETEALMLACSGLWLEATAADFIAIPGRPITIQARVISRTAPEVTLNGVKYLGGADSATALKLSKNTLYTFNHTELLPAGTPLSNPYWLNKKHTTGMYVVPDPKMIGKPENDYSPAVEFDLSVAGLRMRVKRPISYKSTDPVKGEIYRPLEILPPATIEPLEKVLVFSDSLTRKLAVRVTANAASVEGAVSFLSTYGWTVRWDNPGFSLANKGDEATLYAAVSYRDSAEGRILSIVHTGRGENHHSSISRIEYDHVPYQFMLRDAETRLVYIDLKKKGTNIGYIPGAGDDVPAALTEIGYTVTNLSDDMLTSGNLSQYDAIVTGVRAYNVNERLPHHHERLMSYVRNGGNLIVQYNTNSRVGPLKARIGPDSFSITRERVTDEYAVVRFVAPNHPALNFPNKISQADFKGWAQERGIYFAADWSPKYQPILSMNDPGEKPNEGSLIIEQHGAGNFVYTGLAFFRQLPAGNPGAYRLFVNLLSLPRNKS